MNRRRVWAVAAVALATAGLAIGDDWNRSYTTSGAAELRVDTTDANVHINGGDVHQIRVHVATTGWKIRPGEVRVEDKQIGNHVRIDVHIPRAFFSPGRQSVTVDIEAPRDTSTEVHTTDGQIRAEGLHGETRLTSGDGNIETDILEGALDAETGDGQMKIRGRFDLLDLRTGDGGIEARIGPGSKMTGPWRIKSGDGSVTIRVPDGFAADLDARAGDGKLSIDIPLTTSRELKGNGIEGKINGGGPELNVRSGDGTIRLERF